MCKNVRCRKIVPSVYGKTEIEAMLSSFNRASSVGIRNYAMVLMAVRLGMQASNICGLKFKNIHWEKSTIEFVTQKTGKSTVLPLTTDVGNAIIKYLKEVRIYSLAGEFLCEWPRATRKDQWSTNPEHLPDNYKGFPQWNGSYFIQKAQLIGKNTETVIRTVLKSRLYEVQTYRMCLGILIFTKKYSNKALEECCKQAIALNKQKYTFIKNTISVVADDLGETGYWHSSPSKKDHVRGGYVMSPKASSIDTLLSRSKALAD